MSAARCARDCHVRRARPAWHRPLQAARPLHRLLIAGFVALLVLTGCSRGPTPTPTRPPVTGTPAIPPLPNGDERKVDPILLQVLQVYRERGEAAAEQLARDSGLLGGENVVRLTLVLIDTNSQPVVDKVRTLGGTVSANSGNLLEIEVPLQAFVSYVGGDGKNIAQDLAAFGSVREVQVTQPMREH